MAMLGNRPSWMLPVDVGAQPLPVTAPPINPAAISLPSAPKHNWIGILADALAGAAGQPGPFAQLQERRREEDASNALYDKRYALQRTDHLSDENSAFQNQLMLEAWKEAHKTDPLTEAMTAAGIDPKSPAGMALYSKRANTIADPPRFVTGPNGEVLQVGGGGGAPTGPPPAAVAYLKANPGQAAAFEQKYGAGSASQYLGGAGSQAPRSFP